MEIAPMYVYELRDVMGMPGEPLFMLHHKSFSREELENICSTARVVGSDSSWNHVESYLRNLGFVVQMSAC